VRKAILLGLLATTIVPSSCTGNQHDDPAAGELDQRVVDGVAPVSGDSMESERWLKRQLFTLQLPFISDCVTSRGYPELAQLAQDEFDYNLKTYSAEFPEPDRMLVEGLEPDLGAGPVPADPGRAPAGRHRGVRLHPPGRRVRRVPAAARRRGRRARRAGRLYQALFDQWSPVVIDHLTGDDDVEAAVGECLRGNGVPGEFAASMSTEVAGDEVTLRLEQSVQRWISQKIQSGAVSSTAVEDAPMYVECMTPLWDAREAELRQEREAFVEEHREQIAELTDLVSG
jgi:hypothetical protein